MRRKILIISILVVILFTSCGMNSLLIQNDGTDNRVWNTKKLEEFGVPLESLSVQMDGIEDTYHFIYISDLHIIVENEQIAEDSVETVKGRIEMFRQPSGQTSAEAWVELSKVLDSCGADAILLGGDMVDYASSSNIQWFIDGLKNIDTPIVYVGADHDFQAYYCSDVSNDSIKELYGLIDGNEEVPFLELDDLCIVGINNSTSNVSESAINRVKEVMRLEKPILMLIHVPLESLVDTSLSEESKKVWGDRALLWGEDCFYVPNENTAQLLELVYAKDSLVKEVFCGHLHFTWDGQLTENTHQHVFDDAASGNIGIITINGE